MGWAFISFNRLELTQQARSVSLYKKPPALQYAFPKILKSNVITSKL